MKNFFTTLILLAAVFSTAAVTEVLSQIPETDAELRLHLYAGAGVTGDGNLVYGWADQSGNDLPDTEPLSQFTRPHFISNAINGQPALRFTGAQAMVMPTASQIGIDESDYEIFIIYRSTVTHSGVEFIMGGTNTENYELHTNGPNGLRFIPNAGNFIDVGTNAAYTNQQPQLIRLQATNSSGEIEVNRTDQTVEGANSQSTHDGDILLGRRGGGGFDLRGDIAEIIIYNETLSTEDREAVEDYLIDKYFTAPAPTVQASNITFDNINRSGLQVIVTAGDGTSRLIIAREGDPVDAVPADGPNYISDANSDFSEAPEIGTGNYVVYSGNGTSVDITGLDPQTMYHFAVFEYNGADGFTTFLTDDPAENSATTTLFSAGDGTPESPYEINTPEDLDLIREELTASYILNDDIDLATYLSEGNPGYNAGEGWEPIGTNANRFTGSFDGDGFTISNLFIDRDTEHRSLFGRVENAELRNLILQNVDIRGEGLTAGGLTGRTAASVIDNVHTSGSVEGIASVGGLIGTSINSTIQNSSSSANVTNNATCDFCTDAGGLVGSADGGTIRYSYGTGDVIDRIHAGGLVGRAVSNAVIEDSYATGSATVIEESGRAGGLVGNISSSTVTVTRSYATGSVTGTTDIGGLVGFNNDGTITNSYWNTDTSGLETSAGGTGLDDVEMQTSASFEDWDFDEVWDIFEGFSYPYLRDNTPEDLPGFTDPFAGGDGSPGSPFQIETPAQLAFINDYLSYSFILNNDIDLDIEPYNTGQGWSPIGGTSNPFSGSLDGNGFAVYNLYVLRNFTGLGLFVNIDGSVSNLDVLDATLIVGDDSNSDGTGILSAYLDSGGYISNVSTSGTITSGTSEINFMGGISGTANNVTIEDTRSDVTIILNTSSGWGIGGLVGDAGNENIMNRVSATGSIITNENTGGVGGLVGSISSNTTITDAYASVSIEANNSVGGLIGSGSTGTVANSFAIGSVSGNSNVGGLIGGGSATVTNSYWSIEASGQTSSAGGTTITLAELNQKSTFTDWDFDETWQITEGATLPWLRDVSGNHRIGAPTLTGEEGWRLLASPMVDQDYSALLSNIWTQGFEGSNSNGGTANVYTWDQTSTGNSTEHWQPLANMSHNLQPGKGMIVYVYSDDDYYDEETDAGFPKTLFVAGNEPDGDQDLSSLLNTNADGWSLLGNPYASEISWDEFTTSNLSNSVYVWDGDEQEWLTWNGTTGSLSDGIIGAFSGFMVYTEDDEPTLTIPQSAKVGDESLPQTQILASGNKKQSAYLSLNLESADGLRSQAWFQFSDKGSMELDSYDAFKLAPLSNEYAMLASVLKRDGKKDVLLDINHLPISKKSYELPLYVHATQSGEMSLSLADMNVPDGWEVALKNGVTGQIMDLNQPYTFAFNEGENPDLSLLVSYDETELIEGKLLPETFGLAQNYPNPFNPTTTIKYQLPEDSMVRLEVYDMLGRRVAILINEPMQAGYHQTSFDARRLSSGVYFYRMNAGSHVFTHKMTLIK